MSIPYQKILSKAHLYGCLALCYTFCAGKHPFHFLSFYDTLVDDDIMDEDFYIKDAQKFLSTITKGKRYSVTKTNKEDYFIDAPYIGKWYNKGTGHNHFVVMKNEEVIFDPLGESITVRDGQLEDIRLVKKV